MGTVEVPLRNGGVAIIDAADAPRIVPFAWYRTTDGYAHSRISYASPSGRRRAMSFSMHRLLMCFPLLHVDHINRDRLDNRRSNLRLASTQQNLRNSSVYKLKRGRSSPFKGVRRRGDRRNVLRPFEALLYVGNRKIGFGMYRTAIEAALVYDDAAARQFGAYAALNFPERYRKLTPTPTPNP